MPPQAGEVREQVKRKDRMAIVQTPPALDGLAVGPAAGRGSGAVQGIAGQEQQKDDLPHFPQVPTAGRDALRQHRAGATAVGAEEARDRYRVQTWRTEILAIRLPRVATVAPDPGMAAGASIGAVRLRVLPQSHEMLNKG